MKKLLSILLSAVLILSSGAVTALGVTSDTLKIVSATGKAGDSVEVPIIISSLGVTSLLISIEYDPTLTLKGVTNGELFPVSAMTTGGDILKAPYNIVFVDATARQNYTANGNTLAILTFAIDENAMPGDKTVTLTYSPNDTFDCDLDSVEFTVQSGVVTVTKAETTSAPQNTHVGLFRRLLNWLRRLFGIAVVQQTEETHH